MKILILLIWIVFVFANYPKSYGAWVKKSIKPLRSIEGFVYLSLVAMSVMIGFYLCKT